MGADTAQFHVNKRQVNLSHVLASIYYRGERVRLNVQGKRRDESPPNNLAERVGGENARHLAIPQLHCI